VRAIEADSAATFTFEIFKAPALSGAFAYSYLSGALLVVRNASAMSPIGTKPTWRDVRLESGMPSTPDIVAAVLYHDGRHDHLHAHDGAAADAVLSRRSRRPGGGITASSGHGIQLRHWLARANSKGEQF
jgi:hypothetical protein